MKEDAISRQATLEHVQRLDHLATLPDGDVVVRLSEVEDAIINGLPAQSKRKPGRWIPDNLVGGGYWVCTACKHPTEAFAANVIYKFCPFCGADMTG